MYEHVCGGGFVGEDLPSSLRKEGWAMLRALVADLVTLADVDVVTALDGRFDPSSLDSAVVPVTSAKEVPGVFDSLAREQDGTVVIAPETGGVLLRLSRRVLEVGGRLLGSEPEAVQLASDKFLCAAELRRLGVPVLPVAPYRPRPRATEALVVRPRFGAGSSGLRLVEAGMALPPSAGGLLVSPFSEGMATSVLLILGARGALPLAPCRQLLSGDGRFRYLGGRAPLAPGLARRAVELALRAVKVSPGLRGFVGVDLLLSEISSTGDQVVEVNPRLTTSYVGLRRLARGNLTRSWLACWDGRAPAAPSWREGEVSFRADGAVELFPLPRTVSP